MIKKILKYFISSFGYEIKKTSPIRSQDGYQLYHYNKPDGSFDYEKYREVQIAGNKQKIENVWVLEENIKFLSDYLKQHIPNIQSGLCHGTRNGKEQEWFRKYLEADVTGTEISDTAEQFPHTIQWDFHDVKNEWINNIDFIYSNAFDHSFNPKKCLDGWMSCIKEGGMCILEHTSGHVSADELDPFGAEVMAMPYLILSWGEGKYCVTEILNAPVKNDALEYNQFLIIQNITPPA